MENKELGSVSRNTGLPMSLSLSLWLSLHLERGTRHAYLTMPGLLRSDRGGLSVSSPSGERKDACGLRKLLVLKFYWSPA